MVYSPVGQSQFRISLLRKAEHKQKRLLWSNYFLMATVEEREAALQATLGNPENCFVVSVFFFRLCFARYPWGLHRPWGIQQSVQDHSK